MRRGYVCSMEVRNIILRSPDVEKSTAFWSELVGLNVTEQMPGFTFLDGGPVSIIISHFDGQLSDESLTEIVFVVDDVFNAHREMTGRGVSFEGEMTTIMSDNGRDLVAAYFRDPDGHYGRISGWVDAG